MDLWQEIKNTKSLYEIIRSVNGTKFDNIWKQNYDLKFNAPYIRGDQLENVTLQIDNIQKELKELYMFQFNVSKDQLEDGIRKLNEILTWSKNQYNKWYYLIVHTDLSGIWNQVLEGIMSSMRIISVNVLIDNDVTINNMEFHPTSKDRIYKLNFLQQGNKTLQVTIINTTLERIYLSVQGSHMSMFANDSIFTGSGIQINPQFNVNPLPIVIDNCTFLGNINYPAVAIINTTNVSVTNSRFIDLECPGFMSVVVCHDSQLELRNISVVGCVCLSDTILIHHSNVTASYVRVKNNRDYGYQRYEGKLLRVDESILHTDNLTFEGNLNNILMRLERSYVKINFCTFKNNNIKTAMQAGFSIDSSGFTTITNTIFANNTINDPGAIIDSRMKKVCLRNVTLAQNFGTIVTCGASVIEMMSCEFTNNIILSGIFYRCYVTVTNSVFQGNYGSLFILQNSNITATKNYFSDNLNPDSGSIFIVGGNFEDASPSNYMDISFCTFKGNYGGHGGIIYIQQSMKSVSISNCKFYNNSAITGGIATVKGSMIIIKNSMMFGNSASGDAGVLLLTDHSFLQIENTIFTNNSCGIGGGVIKANRNSTLNITNSIFISNRALGSDGGAIFFKEQSRMKTTQCLFINNIAVVSG